MATATAGKCPHCKSNLTYMEGVSSATMKPLCPKCRKEVKVTAPTLLALDNTRR